MIHHRDIKNIIFILAASLSVFAFDNLYAQQNFSRPEDMPVSRDIPADFVAAEVESAPASEPVVIMPSGQIEKMGERTVIDVFDLKNMDALDVFKLLSLKSGLNIVAGQNVKGRVTVYLKNITVLDALKIIVESYNWAYEQDKDIIKIMTEKEFEDQYGYKFGKVMETRLHKLTYANTKDLLGVLAQLKSPMGKLIADEKSNTLILKDEEKKLQAMEEIIAHIDVPVKTRTFQLSYARAEDISKKVAESLTPALGTMKFDERSNKLIVSDSASKLQEITEIIKAFDEKDREVYIEAKIIQLVLSDEFKMGVDWHAILNDYRSLDLSNQFSVLSPTDKRLKVKIGVFENDDFEAFVELLDVVGTTNILSSPRVAAVNNKEAKILVGSTEPYVTTTVTTPASGPSTTAESVNFIEVGVKLYVTPTIHEDNFITMKVKPEVSTVVRTLTTGSNNQVPIVETSEAETTINIKDGSTIIIGGLMKDEKVRTVRKVPVLGDIPLLGMAFRNDSDKTSKTEIVIFLTPRIISGDVEDPAALLDPQSPEDLDAAYLSGLPY